MDIRYKDLLKAIRALGSKQAQEDEEDEEEHTMDTVDEHWGEEEDTEAEHMITCYEGKEIKRPHKVYRGRKIYEESQEVIRNGQVFNTMGFLVPKYLRDRVVAIVKHQGTTISKFFTKCLEEYTKPENILKEDPIYIPLDKDTPIKIDHSLDQRDLYMHTKEVCKALGVSRTTLVSWTIEGKIPCIKVGRAYIFKKKDIKAYLRSQSKK